MTRPVFVAIAATILFGGTMGVLMATAAFGVIRVGQQMLEAIGVIPLLWGERNLFMMMAMSGIGTLPILFWFIRWFFRQALNAERRLVGYKYIPSRLNNLPGQGEKVESPNSPPSGDLE